MKDGPIRKVLNTLTPIIPRRPTVSVYREGPGFINVRVPETFSAQQAPNFSNNDSLHYGEGRDAAHTGSFVQTTINWTPGTAHAHAMRPFSDPARIVQSLQTAYVPVGGQRTATARKPVDVPNTQSYGNQYPLIAQNYYPNLTNLG